MAMWQRMCGVIWTAYAVQLTLHYCIKSALVGIFKFCK